MAVGSQREARHLYWAKVVKHAICIGRQLCEKSFDVSSRRLANETCKHIVCQ